MRNDKHLSEETLNAYLDGELDTNERNQVEAHLDTCAGCRAELEALQKLFAALDELLLDPTPAPDLVPSVLTRVQPRRRLVTLHWLIPAFQGAATAALLAWGWTQLVSYWTIIVNTLPTKVLSETGKQVGEWAIAQWAVLNTLPNATWSNMQGWITHLTPPTGPDFPLPQLVVVGVIVGILWLACNAMILRRSLLNGHKTQS